MNMHGARTYQWKHPSVTVFAAGRDPITAMLEKASAVTLDAIQSGWYGPPFDPFALAEFLHVPVSPNSDILDARTVPVGADRLRIEYNPSRPRARIRYSVAHEIAHSLFRDAAQQIRNRVSQKNMSKDEWELEMLCNLGAAEFLMPIGSLSNVQDKDISMDEVLELRKKFEVSTESVLLRLIRITSQPYILFAASKTGPGNGRYRVNYSISSRSGTKKLPQEYLLPKDSIVRACTAIGYVSKSEEDWPGLGRVRVECVGLSPYPEEVYPRVAGILRLSDAAEGRSGGLSYVTGDATKPHGSGQKILAHIVNDATPNWGAGFGKVVQRTWPEAQSSFRNHWENNARLRLGEIYFNAAEPDLELCHMVCQHGYGPSTGPKIRYVALKDCLIGLRDRALAENATIHMPKIGTGEAGGSWHFVSALIDEVLCGAGLSVMVYELPVKRKSKSEQKGLFDAMP